MTDPADRHDPRLSHRGPTVDTIAAGYVPAVPAGPTTPLVPPIYQTSVYRFSDLDQVDAVFSGQEEGFCYTRHGSPNSALLEALVARLEGAEAALACASGMAAVHAALWAVAPGKGHHILVADQIYGGTRALIDRDLRIQGVEVTYFDASHPEGIRDLARPETRLVYAETISNPLMRVTDVARLAQEAGAVGTLLYLDNTFATPWLCRPLAAGCDVVIHSATKFLGGHGDIVAGVVAGPADLIRRARDFSIRAGATLDPFAAWLAVRGIRTLGVRLARQTSTALRLARALEGAPGVVRVNYPGLPSHPDHATARSQFDARFGPMLSLELEGGRPAAAAFVQALGLIQFAPSLGDVGTTVSYPAATSHRNLTPEQRAALGVGEGLIRVSTGLEDAVDLEKDLMQALEASSSVGS